MMKAKRILALILSVMVVFSIFGASNTAFAKALPKTSISKIESRVAGFKVTMKKVSGITGYQIQYSTNSKFDSSKKIKTTSTTKSVSSLKTKKKYYVRVRTYKKGSNGTKYSSWSSYKTVTTKAKSTSGSNSGSTSNSQMVLITSTGTCYHSRACGRGTYYEVTLQEAKNLGLKPCSRCY